MQTLPLGQQTVQYAEQDTLLEQMPQPHALHALLEPSAQGLVPPFVLHASQVFMPTQLMLPPHVGHALLALMPIHQQPQSAQHAQQAHSVRG